MLFKLIIENFILQIVFCIGSIVATGVAISFFNNLFFKITRRNGYRIMLATGAIGTPIHEIGHAIMCGLFGHKIIKVKLFDPSLKDGTMGSVTHTYDKRNFYHRIGNFFIGIGPIIFGSICMLLLMLILTPTVFSGYRAELAALGNIEYDMFSAKTYKTIFSVFAGSFLCIFDLSNFLNIFWLIFIVLSLCIAMHMKISPADIKTGKSGFVFVCLLFIIINFILAAIKQNFVLSLTAFAFRAGIFILTFSSISIFLLILLVLVAMLIKSIANLGKKHR